MGNLFAKKDNLVNNLKCMHLYHILKIPHFLIRIRSKVIHIYENVIQYILG